MDGAYFIFQNNLPYWSLMNEDSRNVIDDYKGEPIEAIIADLDSKDHGLEIAVENVGRDFNMGTIVRSANAFGVRHVHVIGSRQWNKRGAMMTDKYLHIHYHESVHGLKSSIKDRLLIAVDNVSRSRSLNRVQLPRHSVLLFGAEGPGLSSEALEAADEIVAIEQFGSTRSINVGVAAGVVMYEWVRQHVLS
jgi:tRNA G18 (ribose-2'-O)-methylase SpoU